MRLPPMIGREISRPAYAVAASLLVLSQHAMVAMAYSWMGQPLTPDAEFWLLPLRRFAGLSGLSPLAAAVAFAVSLAISSALAILSFRRASQPRAPFGLAAATIVPPVQIPAVLALIAWP